MVLEDGRSPDGLVKIWRINGGAVDDANLTSLDCSYPQRGLTSSPEVVTEKLITSTEGVNLIRLPGEGLTAEERLSLPSTSLGEDTPTESVGWLSIGVLALVVSSIVFLLLIRTPEPEALELPSIAPRLRRCPMEAPMHRACLPPLTTRCCGDSIPAVRSIGGTRNGAFGTGKLNDLDKHHSDGGGCGCCGSRFTLGSTCGTREYGRFSPRLTLNGPQTANTLDHCDG